MNKKPNDEPRYEGANWDEPTVKIIKKGKRCMDRKVLTKGVYSIHCGGILKQIREKIRQGYEVRLHDENDLECVRFFPFVMIDLKTMKPIAQMIGPAVNWLAGKTVKVSRYGKQMSKNEVSELIDEYEVTKKHDYVTPDTMVTCPKCGTKFRVGRPERDAA